MLDSKRAQDAPVIAEAPLINSYWCLRGGRAFEVVCEGLDAVGVPYTLDLKLVRGLDYYRGTTFEYRGGTLDSAQNALGGEVVTTGSSPILVGLTPLVSGSQSGLIGPFSPATMKTYLLLPARMQTYLF